MMVLQMLQQKKGTTLQEYNPPISLNGQLYIKESGKNKPLNISTTTHNIRKTNLIPSQKKNKTDIAGNKSLSLPLNCLNPDRHYYQPPTKLFKC